MGKTILLRRGTAANLPDLQEGEPGWATDIETLFIGDSTGTGASAVQIGSNANYDTVCVRRHGADPTGNTDSYAAITAAIAAAVAAGKHFVDGEGGLYYISAKLSLSSNITLKNMRLFDPDYRTSSQHTFIEAIGTSGSELTDISLDNIELLGNNSTYAAFSDTWAYNSTGTIEGTGIYFRYVIGGKISNITCDKMISGGVLSVCTGMTVENFESTQVEDASSYTGFSLLGCFDCYASNVRIYNGGDGALFIYNGVNSHIRDSLVEITGTPATYSESGSGMESCTNCSITNTRAKNCWVGFAITEAVVNGLLTGNMAEGCQTGYLIAPFGYGYGSSAITLMGNKVIDITDLGGVTYPVSGYLIYNTEATYNVIKNISLIGNYGGRSSAGTILYIDVPDTKKITDLTVVGNTFEASSLTTFEWESQLSNVGWSTDLPVAYLKGVNGAQITGNTFVGKNESDLTDANIQIVGSEDISLNDNSFVCRGSQIHFVSSDATSARISIQGNRLIDLPSGGERLCTMLGSDHLIKNNHGWGDSLVTGSNATVDAADTMLPYGISRLITAEDQQVNLPTATPKATGSGGVVEPLSLTFTSTANTLTVHPTAADTIYGKVQGADDTVTVGTTKTYTCYVAAYWEIS